MSGIGPAPDASPYGPCPNLRRLAGRAGDFSHAYCTNPLCVPSRGSLFTGRPPHALGLVEGLKVPFEDGWSEEGVFPLFARHGYRNAYAGKWHLRRNDLPEDAPSVRRIAPFGDEGTTKACVRFLESEAVADDGSPFFLVASYSNPHDICQWIRSEPLPEGPLEEPLPEVDPPLPPNHRRQADAPSALAEQEAASPKKMPRGPGVPDWVAYRRAYAGLCAKVDAQIGQVLRALENSPAADNTLVVFTSDHGDGMGAHEWNQKTALFEECVRVPLLIARPGDSAARRMDTPVSNGLDLPATLLDLAGIPVPPELPGRSLVPALRGTSIEPTPLIVETGGPHYYGRALIDGAVKYVVYDRGDHREQLFDLAVDPGETRNLATVPDHQSLLHTCRTRLRQQLEADGDRIGLETLAKIQVGL